MAVAISELGLEQEPVTSPNRHSFLFPEITVFINNGLNIRDDVIELLTAEELTWLGRARTSSLRGQEVPLPNSKNTYPHLVGFSLPKKT
jgi:hypothetical protein